MPQAIPYIRFSSSFKQSEGNSYQRQKDAVQGWLKRHPQYTLSSLVFEDLGKSGFAPKGSKKASGMVKIRQAIDAGLIQAGDAVLVEAFDRATRQQALDAIELISPILRAGVSIITLDDNIEYTQESLNGSHAYLLVAKIQAAHGYSKILSGRVKDSYRIREEKAKNGEQVLRNTPAWLNSDGTIREEIVPRIVEAFDLYISGVGKHTIASRIRKATGKDGKPLLPTCSAPTINGWLTNKTTIGYWQNIPNAYPAIIEPEKFYLVQKLLQERKTERKRTPKNFLVGLVICAECNSTMIIHNVNGKPNSFRCLSHHRLKEAGCTNSKSIPYNIIQYLYLTSAWQGLEKALVKKTITHAERQRILLQQEIDSVSQNIGKLVQMAAALDDVEELQEQISNLNQKRKGLKVELDSIEAGAVVDGDRTYVVVEEQRLMSSDPLVLNAMLKDVGYRINVDKQARIDVIIPDVENRGYYRYIGVKRKPKSNVTDWYRLKLCHNTIDWSRVLKINPAELDVSTFPLTEMTITFNTPIPARERNILIGIEGEEQFYEGSEEDRWEYLDSRKGKWGI